MIEDPRTAVAQHRASISAHTELPGLLLLEVLLRAPAKTGGKGLATFKHLAVALASSWAKILVVQVRVLASGHPPSFLSFIIIYIPGRDKHLPQF